jgi:hypothetical protein
VQPESSSATEACRSRDLLREEVGPYHWLEFWKGEIHHATTDTIRGRFRRAQHSYT